jgi:type I restriction enzyme S subunit
MIFGTIKSSEILNSNLKLKSNIYLSKGYLYNKMILNNNFELLNEYSDYMSNIGVNNRYYVKSKAHGIPFVSSTLLNSNNPTQNIKYVSKKLCNNLDKIIKKDMLLFSAIGTIGEVFLASTDLEGALTPIGNIIRVSTNKRPGYLYSFFKCKYGIELIRNLGSGSVQTYLDPTTFGKTPIPLIVENLQDEIHNLIIEASNLRVQAIHCLDEAVNCFSFLKTDYSSGNYITDKVSISKINNFKKRFDANYNVISESVEKVVKNQKINFIKISDLSDGIFIGPRTKRNYIENGIPFLSTSEMQKANPTRTEKFIGEKTSKGFIVKEGWLLTTRSGTLGDTIYTLPCLNNFAVSEDAIRIVLKNDSKVSNKYLFAFLKSNLGRNSLLAGSYGSVILHLNEEYVGNISVPILDNEQISLIERKIASYIHNMNEAILKENQAIDLIEKEIDAWQ